MTDQYNHPVPENSISQTDTPSSEEKTNLRQRLLKSLREWFFALIFAIAIVFLIQSFLFSFIRVDGNSMLPTLSNNEILFVTVFDVKFDGVNRDDIVICHYPDRGITNFVKRVVGLPGDQVYRKNGVTYIQYTETDEKGETHTYQVPLDINNGLLNSSYDDYEPYTLGEDEYFVAGDNRYNSHDSRNWNDYDPSDDVGPITKDMIYGHVRYVLFPLNHIRSVEESHV